MPTVRSPRVNSRVGCFKDVCFALDSLPKASRDTEHALKISGLVPQNVAKCHRSEAKRPKKRGGGS